MQINDLKEKTADLTDHVEDLATTFYRLSIVKITQKATNIASGVIALMAVCILGLFILLFLGVALSLWLGDILNSRVEGFLLGAAFYLLLFFIVILLKKKIVFPFIRNFIIRKIYDQKH